MKEINKLFKNIEKNITVSSNRFTLFTLIVVFLFLLRSAGYFQPYFPVGINFIMMIALILGILLLKFRSNVIFIITIVFWAFAGAIKLLKIDVWAERTSLYAFESLILGIVLFIYETFDEFRKK